MIQRHTERDPELDTAIGHCLFALSQCFLAVALAAISSTLSSLSKEETE